MSSQSKSFINRFETFCIVGLSSGLEFKHALARLRTNLTCFSTCDEGDGIRISPTFSATRYSTDNVGKDVISSSGCFPIITSSATTPKLYTSHFSDATIV